MTWGRRFYSIGLGVAALLATLWLVRTHLAAQLAQAYFRNHGIASSVEIKAFGLSGVSGRVTLGPRGAPGFSAEAIELRFDPLGWTPRVVEVRLVDAVVQARLDEKGAITLPALQDWLDALNKDRGQSRFVSDDLTVSLQHMRAILHTPGGTVDMTGDARLVKGRPISAAFTAQPATLTYQGRTVRMTRAGFSLQAQKARYRITAQFSGAIQDMALTAQGVEAQLSASGVQWATGKVPSLSIPELHLNIGAKSLRGSLDAGAISVDLAAHQVSARLTKGGLDGGGNLAVKASVDFPGLTTQQIGKKLPLLTRDPALVRAVAGNLNHLTLALESHVENRNGLLRANLTRPLIVAGGRDARLRIDTLALEGGAIMRGAMTAAFNGSGLPTATVTLRDIVWDGAAKTLSADAALRARFDFDMLRGADIRANGAAALQGSHFAFRLHNCARGVLTAMRVDGKAMAREARGDFCPLPGQPLIVSDASGWTIAALAQEITAILPLASTKLDKGAGRISFAAKNGGEPSGTMNVTAADMSDMMPVARFKPLNGRGDITLENYVWRGRLAVSDGKKHPLGTLDFNHVLATRSGSAHIDAGKLAFAPDGLQPDNISPLLVSLKHAQGIAHFTGDLHWTGSEITSRGLLAIDSLDFITPLGTARAIRGTIALKSLLPPITEDNQKIAVSRIDWTLPFSTVTMGFSFAPDLIRVSTLQSGFAEGRVEMDSFSLNPAAPGRMEGAATLTGIALEPLIAASNLGSRAKLTGKISGRIPYMVGPDGLKLVKGRIQSDGPGRLSVDRSLWTQGGAPTNSVQDFAYQALENLAFDEMTADINSIAGGRLQILFHIKGRSDPPKSQFADIPLADLVNGSALQKQIPLPSGTPIDLTLDTSLNFDELLKFYAEAWSKSLGSGP